MRLNTHLNFSGQCEEAFKFYRQVLGGNIQTMMTYGESPMADQVSSEWRDRIIHATLIVGDTELMGADAPPGYLEKPAGFTVTIQVKDPAEAERIFQALEKGGKGDARRPIRDSVDGQLRPGWLTGSCFEVQYRGIIFDPPLLQHLDQLFAK